MLRLRETGEGALLSCLLGAGGGAGGPTRSSGDASVMGAERRGRVVRDVFVLVNQGLWEELG